MIAEIKKQSGQGLLEAVFAIGIMLMVVSAVLALATSNVVGQRQSELQVIANNLAREGIEVVRNIRDSNWLAGQDWDLGLNGGPVALALFDQTDNSWSLNFNILPGQDLLHVSNAGTYSHDVTSGQPSVFSRTIKFEEICQNSIGEDSIKLTCSSGEQKIGYKVKAVVTWKESNRSRQVDVETLMYEWK